MNFRQRQAGARPGFQIAPMIDIVFLLLCFFVASQMFAQWESEIDIKLPTAETGNIPERLPGEIIINVRQDGTTVVNRQTLGPGDLLKMLSSVSRDFPGQPVLIRADRATAYEHVVRALDLCRQADIWNISFATAGSETSARK